MNFVVARSAGRLKRPERRSNLRQACRAPSLWHEMKMNQFRRCEERRSPQATGATKQSRASATECPPISRLPRGGAILSAFLILLVIACGGSSKPSAKTGDHFLLANQSALNEATPT